jgi:ankyrin repeat protein
MKKSRTKEEEIRELLESAAQTGNLGAVPKELLTLKAISSQDAMGMNILHVAASFGQLEKVPKDLLSPELILTKDSSDMTVLHHAATTNQINFVPKDLLTKENLSLPDEEGNTCLHYIANNGVLNNIPESLLDEVSILRKNDFDKDVLDMAINAEFKEENPDAPDQSHLLLKMLSEDTLKELVQKEKDRKDKAGFTHGTAKTWSDPKINLCKKELKRRNCLKKIFQPTGHEDKTLEI